MDLQTTGRKPVTSQDVRPANNFRAYSQQTADSTDVTPSQPNTTPAPTTLQQCQHADIMREQILSQQRADRCSVPPCGYRRLLSDTPP